MPPRPLVLVVLSSLMIAGCRDREIVAYRAPKDPPPADMPGRAASGNPASAQGSMPGAPTDPAMAATAVPTATGSDLIWTAPADWVSKPASAMRKGSYTVRGEGGEADLSITAFPGSTGGLLANLNRWRGQLGLAPLAETELDANCARLDAGDLHLVVADFAGQAGGKPTRLVGAVVPHGGDTWFFKLMGPDALVAREKPAFLEFLRTIQAR